MRWLSTASILALLALGACAPRSGAPGTAALPRSEPAVRVGVQVDTPSVVVSSEAGVELLDLASNRPIARAGRDEPLRVVADSAGNLWVYGPDQSSQGMVRDGLRARPGRGGTLRLGDKPYRGELLIRPAAPGRLTAINTLELEEYLLGVVPHEIGQVGEDLLEAAKAQAVAARTYAIAQRGRRSAQGFDFYATVQDQVYGGMGSEYEVTSRAVRETAGQILTYRGAPVEAYYHSTCAGRTAAIDEVWNEPPRPYLVSVVDVDPATGQAYDHFSSRFHWTERWSAEELQRILSETLADSLPPGVQELGEFTDLKVTERTPSGRVHKLRIETTSTAFTVGGDRVRWILRTPEGRLLNSSLFDLELQRDTAGTLTEVVAEGGGWGHGIGMCQVGAMGRARAGQNYQEILRVYYPGSDLRKLY